MEYSIERKVGQGETWDKIKDKVGFNVYTLYSMGLYKHIISVYIIKIKSTMKTLSIVDFSMKFNW